MSIGASHFLVSSVAGILACEDREMFNLGEPRRDRRWPGSNPVSALKTWRCLPRRITWGRSGRRGSEP